ncbi:MAG: hypothetical protein ACOVQ4_22095 [Flectobacillus sp.]|uniref:hypothetical protein n=1 Tax=Flectobacillus sp. TaxID=50419 RepID=UPI003B9D6120
MAKLGLHTYQISVRFKQLIVLTLLLVAGQLQGVAQQYFPVVARFTQLPPYPVYLSDFSNPAQTNLSIQVQMNDRNIASRAFRIRVYIEGQGFLIQSTDFVQGEPSITLVEGQVYNIPASQVANYFKQYNLKITPEQYRRPFNEGAFRFGVEIIDFQTNRPISGIQWSTPVWLVVNEPPVWVMPQNQISITPTNPQNINFQWAPRHNNVNDVEYEFTITDLMLNNGFQGNVQNLFLSQPAYYQTRTRNTVLNYNATMPPLVVGRTYAYRVQAIAKRGSEDVGVFRNNGYSEIQYFTYGEAVKLNPPTNLQVAWTDDFKGATFNWKGDNAHKNFTVEFREKNAKDWKNVDVVASTGGLYNTFLINNLAPEKSYEMRVTGIDAQGNRATAQPIDLTKSPAAIKQEKLILKGNIVWAFRASEQNLNAKGSVLEASNNANLPARKTQQEALETTSPANIKHPLEKAIVTLYNSNVELTLDNIKSAKPERIATAQTDAQGQYTFDALGVKLLSEVKNLYLVAEYQGENFAPAITKLTIGAEETGAKTASEMVLLANSIRFVPKVLIGNNSLPSGETIENNSIEEIALYRLKSVVDKNPYLQHEGNLKGERASLIYNKDTYIKVGEFSNTTILTQIFNNKAFNDKFVLRVKQKDRKAVVFPVNDITDFQEGKYLAVTDYFAYKAPANVISGYVERRSGGKTERVSNAAVQIFNISTRTNSEGYYEIEIPQVVDFSIKVVGLTTGPKFPVTKGMEISIKAIDPFNTVNNDSKTFVYQNKDIQQNFTIDGNAHYIEGRVFGRDTKIISGATVTYKSQTVKSNDKGYFNFAVAGPEMTDSLKVEFDNYDVAYVNVSKFKKTKIEGKNASEAKSNLLTKVKAITDKTQLENFYTDNFSKANLIPATFNEVDSVKLENKTVYRVIAYTNQLGALGLRSLQDSSVTVDAIFNIEDADRDITKAEFIRQNGNREVWKGGYIATTYSKELTIKITNKKVIGKDTNASSDGFVEEEINVALPKKYTQGDTLIVKVRLKPASIFNGAVYDSTFYIAGVRENGRKAGDEYKGLEGVEVAVNGAKIKTDAKGKFKLRVPKGEDIEMELTKEGFSTLKHSFTAAVVNQYNGNNTKAFYMMAQDKDLPKFKTLMNFSISIDNIVKHSNNTYMISGNVLLDKGKLEKSKNAFKAGDTKTLTFKNIIVKEDTNKTNAIITQNKIDFVETEAKIKLFGYAPILLTGNPIGEPYIRLQQTDSKSTSLSSNGKIGASTMEFTQTEMMGITFGKMELELKKDDVKEAKVGKFDDKLSDKDAGKREKDAAEKKELEKQIKSKVEEANKTVLQDIIAAKSSSQAARDNATKELNSLNPKEVTAVPDKEPLLLAFAPTALEELSETKEYKIVFPEASKVNQIKKLGAKKDTAASAQKPKHDEFLKFPLGAGGLVSAGIDPESAVLKKAGISMKGVILIPEIWRFTNTNPLTIEKLEISTDFKMKSIMIGKSDPDKKEFVKFGVADTWMCYINTVQIFSEFKGFNLGGTFNTDKENYVNINALGFTNIGGKIFPNVDISTPKDGFRFSKLRFKTVGKKNITIKGNPKDKSYEIEGSLRIEWDESDLKSFSSDSTDRFGKRLSQDEIDKNVALRKANEGNAAFEAEQASLKTNKENKKYEDTKKQLAQAEEELKALAKLKDELTNEYDKLSKEQQSLNVKRIALTRKYSGASRDSEQAKEEEKAQTEAETSNKNKEKDVDARWKKWQDDNTAKENEITKLKATLAPLEQAREKANKEKQETDEKQKAEDAKKQSEKEQKNAIEAQKREAIDAGKAYVSSDTTSKKSSSGLDWKKRIFPLEVTAFTWSTSGKFLVAVSPSQDALRFESFAIKIRRIVYTRGMKTTPTQMTDLLKMSEDEVNKMNTSSKFNDANTYVNDDGKRVGALSKDNQESKANASVDGLALKAIEDKVVAANPDTLQWAMGFAGGVELDFKSINIDSDVSMYIGDFGKGFEFRMNEFALKIDATSFRAYAKVKIATSGKKVGFEGEGEFEGAELKAAMSLKFYKFSDGSGYELGAALKMSTGATGIVTGPITWTALGGGFDWNTAEGKFSVFLLGDARSSGLPEKVVSYKKVRLSLDFVGGRCGAKPILRGYAELWTGSKGEKPEKICNVAAEVNFCDAVIVCKIDCEIEMSEKKVKVDALAFISPSAGFFMGANVRAELFGMNLNGRMLFGIVCDTKHPDAPKELGLYLTDIPNYLYQSDNKTISALYLGVDLSYEKRENGGASAFGVDLVRYSVEILVKGRLKAGINFSNGNFMINSMVKLEAEGKADILGFNLGGKFEGMFELGGGYTTDMGWNFLMAGRAKLEIGAGKYQDKNCNDFSITGIKWCDKCISCCSGRKWYCPVTIVVPYPCGEIDRYLKLCVEGQFGVSYRQRGPDEGWKAFAGGAMNRSNNSSSSSVGTNSSSLTAETSLKPGESRTSPNGIYKLMVESDGNVVITKKGVKIWETRTGGKNVDAFKMQDDGNLVAYAVGGRAVWASGTHGKGNKSSVLVMQDDGNLVIYTNDSNPIWSSGTRNVYTQEEIDKITVKNGESLRVNDKRTSTNGKYYVTLQSDGNVVLYKGEKALWATGTSSQDVYGIFVQRDGNLVAYRGGDRPTWASNTADRGGRETFLMMQDDGNLVLYKRLGSSTPGHITVYFGEEPIWASGTFE